MALSRLIFTEDIAVGIEEIDDQHKDLIAMINGVHDMLGTPDESGFLTDLVGEMVNYAALHFSTEEKYMELTGYPDLKEHRKEHDVFRKAASNFKQENKDGTLDAEEVFTFLSNWFSAHLVQSDGHYADYCREQEII